MAAPASPLWPTIQPTVIFSILGILISSSASLSISIISCLGKTLVEMCWFYMGIAQIALDPHPPSVKRANVETKCPKPTWQAPFTPPPYGQCPYGNNKFQKGASLIKGIKYIRNIKQIKCNMSAVQHTHTAWSDIKFIEYIKHIYVLEISSPQYRMGGWH